MKRPNPRSKGKTGGHSRKTSKPVSAGKARERQLNPGPEADVVELAAKAQEVYSKTGLTHRKADELHKSIEKMHGKVSAVRKKSEKPPLAAESELQEEEESPRRRGGKPFPIVGIGASAGGFEAFSEFLKALSGDTGMAFVMVQHLDPNHKSQLTELLGRSSAVPVVEAKNNVNVEQNRVYVIPANARITIQGGRLRVAPRKEDELPPMPVDAFFRSLAAEQQDRAIGIVLSGTGTDGTLGIEAIKGEGGITFAQHEGSAKYYGMPGSAIGSRNVDFVLTPEGMAAELNRISQHPYLRRDERRTEKTAQETKSDQAVKGNEKEMGQLFSLLQSRTGVDFTLYKRSTLKRRIVRQMILHRVDSLGKYLSYLEKQPREVNNLFNDLLISVTSFFRDAEAFQILKRIVLPKLMRAHPDDSPLRFWVCGCSTGEEAYSMAIAVAEFFERTRTHRHVQIFASDISDNGISKARAGIYPENIVQDVSPERLRRFFSKADGHYQVNKSIRDMVVFARQNVIVDPPFSNLDMITCRNVLIYLDAMLQRKIMPMFHYALRANGFLMLGNSETVGASSDLFSVVNKKHKIYAKKHSYTRPSFVSARKAAQEVGGGHRTAQPANAEVRPPDLQALLDKMLLRDFTPATVVVSEDLEVLHFRGRTGDYLEHSAGAASLNLLRMVRESLVIDLRAALTKATKSDEHVRHTAHVRRDGTVSEVIIEVVPFRPGPERDRFFLVIFRDAGGAVAEPRRGKAANSDSAHDGGSVAKLRSELATTRESLQTIIAEQETNNEELKSANEEIQSSNEELQSTNEELETAKEELQSTNEELTTLNEELQTRNSELGQAINDLTNLLASINVAILMLGEDLTIRRYTPMAERLFSLIPSDLGRRLSDLNRSILIPDLDENVSKVITNLTAVERDVQDRDGRWYSLRIRPYRTRENRIEGVVIMLVDIDHLKRALDLVLATAKEPLITLGADLKVRKANESFYRAFHMRAEETEGRFLYEAGSGQWNTAELRKLLEEVLPKSKEIRDFPMEAIFPEIGKRHLLINAFRFHDEGWGLQMILMAIEDVTQRGAS
jgi:two-component system, chemotaxis family, CheB/CheR fusion protein